MFKEAEKLPVGSIVNERIISLPDRPYLVVDTVMGMTAYNGDVELSLISIQGRALSQTYQVTAAPPGSAPVAAGQTPKGIMSGPIDFDNGLAEVAVLRMTKDRALDTCAVLMEQAIKSGAALSPEMFARFTTLLTPFKPT
jgi:hypothetical protein